MTKAPSVFCGHHVDDNGTECELWAITWMTKAPGVFCGLSRGRQRHRVFLWAITWMTKAPSVFVGHHVDDKVTECGL